MAVDRNGTAAKTIALKTAGKRKTHVSQAWQQPNKRRSPAGKASAKTVLTMAAVRASFSDQVLQATLLIVESPSSASVLQAFRYSLSESTGTGFDRHNTASNCCRTGSLESSGTGFEDDCTGVAASPHFLAAPMAFGP